MSSQNDKDALTKFMGTPQDSTKMNDYTFASTLVLSFIGYLARPSGIDPELLEECIDAFNSNRGKTEIETKVVQKVITEWRKTHPQ